MAVFTQDWFSRNTKYWERYVVPVFSGKPNLNFLEIGCFEGRSTLWMLENILTADSSKITVIDTFQGSSEHTENNIDVSNMEEIFISNTEKYKEKITIIKGFSQDVLRNMKRESEFDLIFVDGSHHATDVLEDAILSFRYLRSGGFLIFDDYTWMQQREPFDRPGVAIESFMSTFREKIELIHIGWQVFLLKK